MIRQESGPQKCKSFLVPNYTHSPPTRKEAAELAAPGSKETRASFPVLPPTHWVTSSPSLSSFGPQFAWL